ncbi:MAG: hypothetical protein FJ280_00280 [Planctomycetes bacterium]|nr:hypothetical protein [Planctomycetota bacterium]
MRSSTKSRQDEYLARVNALYSDAEKWIEGTDLEVSRGTMELDEEALGRYAAPTLTIQDAQGKKVADLLPVGAQIIGAEGRVDIVGRLDRNHLLYLPPKEAGVRRSFKGMGEAGWYWIGETRLRRVHRLAQELFLDLLSEVSDYDVG